MRYIIYSLEKLNQRAFELWHTSHSGSKVFTKTERLKKNFIVESEPFSASLASKLQ